MLNPFVCGTFDHEDDPLLSSSSPKKSKRKDNNNPYSTRGLDKFSALLADLDEKRQKIYSQMRPHDISFVRFMYSNNTDDVVPIVVKVKNKDHHQKHKSEELNKLGKARNLSPISESMDKSSTESNATSVEERKKQQPKLEDETKVSKKSFFNWNMKKLDMWKPYFYVPMILILILVLLTLFGRSFATLCTCVLWYMIPTLKGGTSSNSNPRKSMKKKDYVRGLSEKKVVTTELGTNKKKDYVRGFSEKKMVLNEGVKKKDFVRRWSEKKMDTEGIVSITSDNIPEASKNKSITAKHGHKKSW